MKLAIIADIHGNLAALESVLADAKNQNVTQIIVNGDLVNRGPDNVAVMERIHNDGYLVILGNHDDLMRKWVERDDDLPAEWFEDDFWLSTAFTAHQLNDAGWITPIRDWPMTHKISLKNAPTLLISHGSPRHYREGYGQFLSDEDISEITQMHPADVLIGSHTHQPLQRTWGKYQVLNTGSVGTPFNGDPRAQYLIVTLQNNHWHTEFRRVPYDRTPTLKAFETSGLLENGGLSAVIFREEIRHARSYFTPFWMWTEEQNLPRNETSWDLFQKAFPERFKDN